MRALALLFADAVVVRETLGQVSGAAAAAAAASTSAVTAAATAALKSGDLTPPGDESGQAQALTQEKDKDKDRLVVKMLGDKTGLSVVLSLLNDEDHLLVEFAVQVVAELVGAGISAKQVWLCSLVERLVFGYGYLLGCRAFMVGCDFVVCVGGRVFWASGCDESEEVAGVRAPSSAGQLTDWLIVFSLHCVGR